MTPGASFRHWVDVRHLRRLAGMQHVPAVAGVRRRDTAPCSWSRSTRRRRRRTSRAASAAAAHLVEDGAAAEQLRLELGLAVVGRAEAIHALEDAVARRLRASPASRTARSSRSGSRRCSPARVHPADAVLDDDRQLVGVGRVVGDAVRHRTASRRGCCRPGAAALRRPASSGRRCAPSRKPRMRESAPAQIRSATRWKPNIE